MDLQNILLKRKKNFHSLFKFSLQDKKIYHLDLSVDNKELNNIDLFSVNELQKYIDQKLLENNSDVALGGYAEDRMVYRKSALFGEGDNTRSIHLSIDIWLAAKTKILAPLDSVVHSFKHNDNYGDYGPTIILEHQLEGLVFYSLYGHLSLESIDHLTIGQRIKGGECFASLGNPGENGNWPPHLHFQLITTMGEYMGDFPGVSSKQNKNEMLNICLNPNLILNV